MRRTLALLAAAAFAISMVSAADAAPCKDAKGRFTACPAAAAAPAGGYSLDAKGNCHDAKGKMAKKTLCSAPASAAPATSAMSSSSAMASSDGPKCVKGKRCGNACISVKDVCHK